MEFTQEELDQIRIRLETLRIEHRDLDEVLERLLAQGQALDELQVRRLKKRKLLLKDQITQLEQQLVPDIRA
jgi:hypothetical protein